jgi:hypothetical protein
MKDRITQLEKDLRSTYALAAIIKSYGTWWLKIST